MLKAYIWLLAKSIANFVCRNVFDLHANDGISTFAVLHGTVNPLLLFYDFAVNVSSRGRDEGPFG